MSNEWISKVAEAISGFRDSKLELNERKNSETLEKLAPNLERAFNKYVIQNVLMTIIITVGVVACVFIACSQLKGCSVLA